MAYYIYFFTTFEIETISSYRYLFVQTYDLNKLRINLLKK